MLTISARNLSKQKGVGNTVKKTDSRYRVESNYIVELKETKISLSFCRSPILKDGMDINANHIIPILINK